MGTTTGVERKNNIEKKGGKGERECERNEGKNKEGKRRKKKLNERKRKGKCH